MKAKSLWIALAGTLAGLAFAVGGIVLSAGLLVDGGAQVVVTDFSTGTTRPVIQVDQVHLYLYVVIGGFLAGAIIGAVTAMLASHANPDEPRFSIVPVTLIGSVLGAAIAYAVFRATLGIGGTIVDGVITVSAFRAFFIFGASGAVAGAVVAVVAEWLSRTEVVGLEGEAWPEDRRSFMRETAPAMLIPLLAVSVVAVTIFAFSRALLAGNNVLAVTIASVFSVAVLAGAAVLAAHPPRHQADAGSGEEQA